jgi:hypothetical protein
MTTSKWLTLVVALALLSGCATTAPVRQIHAAPRPHHQPRQPQHHQPHPQGPRMMTPWGATLAEQAT